MKKLLFIVNPRAGRTRSLAPMFDVVARFSQAGYLIKLFTTEGPGDAKRAAAELGGDFDLVVCAGGDGTLNETLCGLMTLEHRPPVGYIPHGSTNDFANSLHLSKDIVKAARDIVTGDPVPFDIGSFNGRSFSYVASFGAFTKASYATPQNVKNALGHLAYILEGINSIASIRAEHMAIEADGITYEGDYIFGAISNSTSIAGILTLKPEFVDMSDGMFELLLVKAPRDLIELAEIVHMLTTQNYESEMLTFMNAAEFHIHANAETSWTLDGEYQEGCEEIKVENLHHAIRLMMR